MSTEVPSDPITETGIHIIIKGELHDVELFPEISDLSGCAVAEHKQGKKQKERPHYHCWIPWENPTSATELMWKTKCRSYYDTKLTGLNWNRNANAYYTVKAHNSYQKWLEYVVRDPDVKIASWFRWNRIGEPPEIIVKDINELVLAPVTVIPVQAPIKQPRKAPANIRFWEHIQGLNLQDVPTVDEIIKYWVEWTQGNYELRNVSAPIRYVLYKVHNGDDYVRDRLIREIRHKIFSDF